MSQPFIRNWARLAMLSLVAVSSVAFAQGGLKGDGVKFLKAVRDRDGTVVSNMVEEAGSDTFMNARDIVTGQTALHIVAARRDAQWITFLTQKGANPNIADREGVTPLMISSRLGHVEGVTALIRAGAQVDPPTATGETPLIFAVHSRDLPLVRLLLANGADPDRADNSGRTARDYANLIGERRLSDEFSAADGVRKDASQQYGPSF